MKTLLFYIALLGASISSAFAEESQEAAVEVAGPIEVEVVYEVPDIESEVESLNSTIAFVVELETLKDEIFGKYKDQLHMILPYQYNGSAYINMLDAQIGSAQNKTYLLNEYREFYTQIWKDLKNNKIVK